jgi:hypothetical protein
MVDGFINFTWTNRATAKLLTRKTIRIHFFTFAGTRAVKYPDGSTKGIETRKFSESSELSCEVFVFRFYEIYQRRIFNNSLQLCQLSVNSENFLSTAWFYQMAGI